MIDIIKRYSDTILIFAGLAACIAVGTYFSHMGMAWYHTLILPALIPADWVFSLAWTIIFVANTLAAYILVQRYRHTLKWRMVVGLFILNVFLNIGWTYLFFGAHSINLALLDAIVLQFTLLVIIAVVWRDAREVAFLLLPYAAWMFFAIYLNYSVLMLN